MRWDQPDFVPPEVVDPDMEPDSPGLSPTPNEAAAAAEQTSVVPDPDELLMSVPPVPGFAGPVGAAAAAAAQVTASNELTLAPLPLEAAQPVTLNLPTDELLMSAAATQASQTDELTMAPEELPMTEPPPADVAIEGDELLERVGRETSYPEREFGPPEVINPNMLDLSGLLTDPARQTDQTSVVRDPDAMSGPPVPGDTDDGDEDEAPETPLDEPGFGGPVGAAAAAAAQVTASDELTLATTPLEAVPAVTFNLPMDELPMSAAATQASQTDELTMAPDELPMTEAPYADVAIERDELLERVGRQMSYPEREHDEARLAQYEAAAAAEQTAVVPDPDELLMSVPPVPGFAGPVGAAANAAGMDLVWNFVVPGFAGPVGAAAAAAAQVTASDELALATTPLKAVPAVTLNLPTDELPMSAAATQASQTDELTMAPEELPMTEPPPAEVAIERDVLERVGREMSYPEREQDEARLAQYELDPDQLQRIGALAHDAIRQLDGSSPDIKVLISSFVFAGKSGGGPGGIRQFALDLRARPHFGNLNYLNRYFEELDRSPNKNISDGFRELLAKADISVPTPIPVVERPSFGETFFPEFLSGLYQLPENISEGMANKFGQIAKRTREIQEDARDKGGVSGMFQGLFALATAVVMQSLEDVSEAERRVTDDVQKILEAKNTEETVVAVLETISDATEATLAAAQIAEPLGSITERGPGGMTPGRMAVDAEGRVVPLGGSERAIAGVPGDPMTGPVIAMSMGDSGKSDTKGPSPENGDNAPRSPSANKGPEVFGELRDELNLRKATAGPPARGLTTAQIDQLLQEARAVDSAESIAGTYRVKFKATHDDWPGGEEWEVHHSIPQKFRQTLCDADIDLDNPAFLRGVRATPGPTSNVHARITSYWQAWDKDFVSVHNRAPAAAEILEQARNADWKFSSVYWEAEKAAGIPVPVSK